MASSNSNPSNKKSTRSASNLSQEAANLSADLAFNNNKLRKQLEEAKKELAESIAAYEKLRIETAKEISRLKSSLESAAIDVSLGGASRNNSVIDSFASASERLTKLDRYLLQPQDHRNRAGTPYATPVTSSADRELALRRQIVTLERELMLQKGRVRSMKSSAQPSSLNRNSIALDGLGIIN